jgi:hypothetical protein
VSQKGVEDGSFLSAKASDYLRGYFHAAALAGYDMRAVAAWVSGADPDVPQRILAAVGACQWALTLSELRSEAHKTAATARMVISRALSFTADPALAASVLLGPGWCPSEPQTCSADPATSRPWPPRCWQAHAVGRYGAARARGRFPQCSRAR